MRALGLIETVGLTAAMEAADSAVKSANVKLIGYENTRGGGLILIKLEGDVGAVNAAVSAARSAAAKVGRVSSTRVIPRPARGLELLVYSRDTVGRREARLVDVEKGPEQSEIDQTADEARPQAQPAAVPTPKKKPEKEKSGKAKL